MNDLAAELAAQLDTHRQRIANAIRTLREDAACLDAHERRAVEQALSWIQLVNDGQALALTDARDLFEGSEIADAPVTISGECADGECATCCRDRCRHVCHAGAPR